MKDVPYRYHSSHWGAFRARMLGGRLDVAPFPGDPHPPRILGNLGDTLDHPARIAKPLVRRGWLTDGPGPDARRGADDYVELDWDAALDLTARELMRLGGGYGSKFGSKYGAEAENTTRPLPGQHVFGGSYGWSSAGRFHHAQSQVHRFLNVAFGGYVRSVDTYSSAAGQVIHDLVLGNPMRINREQRFWEEIEAHSDLVIAFGGLALRNLQIAPGGISSHDTADRMANAAARGCRFVSLSPVGDDLHDLPGIERLQPRPATDCAVMLGMAYRLVETGKVDHGYLDRYTTGYAAFARYLTGESDGIAKTPEWAAAISGLSADRIRGLADRLPPGARISPSPTRCSVKARESNRSGWRSRWPRCSANGPAGGRVLLFPRVDGRHRQTAAWGAAALTAARPQRGRGVHPGGPDFGPAAQPR